MQVRVVARSKTGPSLRTLVSPVIRVATRSARVLDFDVETVAAGFADPEWVPQKITCVAWSWIDEDTVQSRICGPAGIFGQPKKRADMLKPLLEAIAQADMVTGHNIIRFDLPVINAECLRLNLPPIATVKAQDTIRLARSKGFKKGQDNLGRLLDTEEEKVALDWQAWQDAYDERNWSLVRERCEVDVMQHKAIRKILIERGVMRAPIMWRAGIAARPV